MQTPAPRKLPLKSLAVLLLGLTLSACGSDDDDDDDGSHLSNISSGTPGGPGSAIFLGSGQGASFNPGEIESSPDGVALLPGGSTSLEVTVTDEQGKPIAESIEVTFSSACLGDGRSTMSVNDQLLGGPINTTDGRAEVTYTAVDCLDDDEVRATISHVNAAVNQAETTVTIAPPRIGSGTGEDFKDGQIATALGEDTLPPNGTTELSLTLTDEGGTPANGASEITFSSSCIDSGLAQLTHNTEMVDGPVSVNNGRLDVTYAANGCLNDDKITAEATYEGLNAGEATATINNVPALFGSGLNENFVLGAIDVGIEEGTLSAGGATSLTVTMVNEAGELITGPAKIEFTSYCLASGLATLTKNDEEIETTVGTSNGFLEVTYNAKGCNGTDAIVATAFYSEINIGEASASIQIDEDEVHSLSFVSANPDLISIKGAGGREFSTITFEVFGNTGLPLRDIPVELTLSNELGGVYLSQNSSLSDANGQVKTTVHAGTVPTTVRVTAATPEVATESSKLVISTGILDQNSFSLSAANPFPASAWNYDGVETEVNIKLADAFNNPPPDGTKVYFTTSGGAIEPECTSRNGECSVTWRSQSPRPGLGSPQPFWFEEETDAEGNVIAVTGPFCPDGMAECRHGRARVMATALGNESFIDETGNGLYDGPDDIFATGGNCSPNTPIPSAAIVTEDAATIDGLACDDLAEAYLDKNFNGQRDSGEEYVDENSDGIFTEGNGIYDGVLCTESAEANGDCTRGTVTIRDDITIVMTCRTPYRMQRGTLPGQRDVVLGTGESTSVDMVLADCNGNGMPPGTTISVNDSLANNVEAAIFPEQALPGSTSPTIISVRLTADEDVESPVGGTIHVEINVPTPDGTLTSAETIQVSAP